MKIFLSWSGKLSHEIACIFRDWLPSVIQSVKPYVSSEDIDKGTRWSSDIAGELEVSNYGIILVTKDNLNAQWINFEAGALSKSLDKANVSPFLFDIKRSEVQGPLLQFQSTIFEKEDIFKLLQSVNNRLEEEKKLENLQLSKAFEVWWSELETKLNTLKEHNSEKPEKAKEAKENTQSEILEEILELVRTQQRTLSSPEVLLPTTHLKRIFELFRRDELEYIGSLIRRHRRVWITIAELEKDRDEFLERKLIEKDDWDNFNFDANLFRLKDEIKELGRELKDAERREAAKLRDRRIIPEF